MALTAQEKVRRDAELCSDLALGMSREKAAAKYEISSRQVRNIWDAFGAQAKQDLRGRDPIDIVWELVEGYKARHEALADIATTSDKDTTRISALRAQNDVSDRMASLLQATGILPRDLGTMRVEMDVRFMASTILRIFEEEHVPETAQQKIIELFRSRLN